MTCNPLGMMRVCTVPSASFCATTRCVSGTGTGARLCDLNPARLGTLLAVRQPTVAILHLQQAVAASGDAISQPAASSPHCTSSAQYTPQHTCNLLPTTMIERCSGRQGLSGIVGRCSIACLLCRLCYHRPAQAQVGTACMGIVPLPVPNGPSTVLCTASLVSPFPRSARVLPGHPRFGRTAGAALNSCACVRLPCPRVPLFEACPSTHCRPAWSSRPS
jgi:hypothetical protein